MIIKIFLSKNYMLFCTTQFSIKETQKLYSPISEVPKKKERKLEETSMRKKKD